MGDRGNIVVEDDGGKRVYLYSHWGGYRLPQTLQMALKRGTSRWDDAPYLARIIFCDMTAGENTGTTGYGISSTLGDYEYPLLIVDTVRQKVFLENPKTGQKTHEITFADYVVLPADSLTFGKMPALFHVTTVGS